MAKGRLYGELKSQAVNFWPLELAEKEKDASIIPRLIETQEKFISLLHVADSSPHAWKEILPKTTQLPANLFLKHLMILADIGGEPLERFKPELPSVFEQHIMSFIWQEKRYKYTFKTLGDRTAWSNERLAVDGSGLAAALDLTDVMEDVITLLIHGAASTNDELPQVIADKCIIGSLLGDKPSLDKFVRQRYIWVSQIITGAAANRMGYLAQDYVKHQLQAMLPRWDFSKKTIPGVSQTGGRTDMPFDMVAEAPNGKLCAIEVSFQFTTNSTIERKGGQAQSRQRLLHKKGHRIAYVIDGAGNFERRSAISTICRYSDCTVTFRDSEITRLAEFLREMAGGVSGPASAEGT
jgi:hypothetical protein